MIMCINTYKVKHGEIDNLVAELNAYGVEEMFRIIPGNAIFNYSIAVNNKDTLYLVDAWETEGAFEAHLKSGAIKIWHNIKDKYIIEKNLKRFDF